MRHTPLHLLILTLALGTFCRAQDTALLSTVDTTAESKTLMTHPGPQNITRSIIEDRKGNIWMAAFDGIFRYDGKVFTKMSDKLTANRFCSVMEDRRGNLWFGSIGSGVYYYDGRAFKHFSFTDGLVNNDVVSIYEDRAGGVWFGANGGVSHYNGKSFRNFLIEGDSMRETRTWGGLPHVQRPPNEVNSIMEDKEGRFWFATRGNTFVYDGKTFDVVSNDGVPFTNVRSLMEDKKGNMWLGGGGGLWKLTTGIFRNYTRDFVGYVYEDKKGNIWTSSNTAKGWAISRYDERLLSHNMLSATQISLPSQGNAGMVFGITEASDGAIWFGGLRGAYRYDGKSITDLNHGQVPK